MSETNSINKSIIPKLDKLLLVNKIKVYIPDNVLLQIKYLCSRIHKDEWSGILFYEVEGSIKDMAQMKITLKHILLMDKGSSGYTEFEWDGEDVVKFRMEFEGAMDWHVGHIHSHNTMGVFFSGTDMGELNDNCTNHNYYLSVIVNNFMDMTGKVAFTGEYQPSVYSCKDEDGKDYELTIEHHDDTKKTTMIICDCEIETEQVVVTIDEDFRNRVDEIEKSSKSSGNVKPKYYGPNTYANNWGYGEEGGYYNDSETDVAGNKRPDSDTYKSSKNKIGPYLADKFPGFNPKKKNMEESLGEGVRKETKKETRLQRELREIEAGEETDSLEQTIEEDFATYLIRLGSDDVDNDTLEDAVEDLETSNINPVAFAKTIVGSYGQYYDRFFVNMPSYHVTGNKGEEIFERTLETIIEVYEELEADYTCLSPIIMSLKELGMRLQKFYEENNGRI